MPDARDLPHRVFAALRTGLRATTSGPRSRQRLLLLTHPLLDPGVAYWIPEDDGADV
ncbi:hypothetical protein JK358_03650 [Nocardia sp. 2]|uniref:Uncharacterized protein n=1 Tax=Nocardia acididurans TaxID=2802282 RepID=A0ABS1LZV7_9NOCA|nr:hypothetical protein [Nocardia acididurans]MBL1073480.1 hypothetical protein [Nocardia acididurans]